MSSKRGCGRPSTVAKNDDSFSKGKSKSVSHPKIELLTEVVADVNLDPGQDDGEWEVYARKSKNRGVGRASRNTWQTQNDNFKKPACRGNGRRPQLTTSGSEGNNVTSNPLIRPPLEHGWNWQSRTGSKQFKSVDDIHVKDEITADSPVMDNSVDDSGEEGSDFMEDTDDDLMSDDYDSDTSQKSHETRKKSKWFKKFFEILDALTVEKINEPERQWHCPACQGGGPGAIDWYTGLQPLINHAKTKGSIRLKIHRELADLLDEELRRRGTSVIPAGEVFGKWKGLNDDEKDHEIVWPPIVIIQNTKLEQDEKEKWIGMGNKELLDYFSGYDAEKARQSYGPQGHRGMSVLIFQPSATGYFEADCLHKHFAEQGTGRDAWFGHRNLFLPGGKRQLYGYMAAKEDLEFFNRHSQGKSRLKYEMRLYQEMVTNQVRKMGEDNQQLLYLKNRVVKEQKHAKALEESFGIVSEKLRKTIEENRIVRLRTKMQHEENKEEDQIKIIHDSRNAKEEDFERMQQEKREKVKQSSISPLNAEQGRVKVDEYLKFVEFQDKEMENFVAEEEKLRQVHKDNIAAMMQRHWEERVQLEEKFNDELAKLMEKYSPSLPETKSDGI